MTALGVLTFRLLGPLAVDGDRGAIPLDSPKQRLVLARLLVGDGPVAEDELIDALWGERPPASALSSLRAHISRLRAVLAGGPTDAVVLHGGSGYRLVTPFRLDAAAFAEQVAAAAAARQRGDLEGAAGQLEAALGLWRGPALADFRYEPFAQPSIGRLEAARLAALEDRMELELELGRAAAALPELEALAIAHPLRERVHALLMLALYRSGRQADALAAYQRARRTQLDELGLEPSPLLRDLQRGILTQAPQLSAPSRAAVSEQAVSQRQVAAAWQAATDAVAIPPVDDALRCELLLSRGDGLRREGRIAEARRAYGAAVRLAASCGDPEKLARAALGLAGPPEDTLEGEPLDELLMADAIVRLPPDHPTVARLRARLAVALVDRGEHARGAELLDAASAAAAAAGDAPATAYVLRARHRSWFDPAALEGRLALDDELLALGTAHDSPEILAWGHRWRSVDLMEIGAFTEIDAALTALEGLADTSEVAFHRWGVVLRRAGNALLRQPMEASEPAVLAALAVTEQLGSELTRFAGVNLLWVCRWLQGRIAEVEPVVTDFAGALPKLRPLIPFLHAELDRREPARTAFEQLADDGFAAVIEGSVRAGRLLTLGLLAEACSYLGDAPRSALLHEQLAPHAGKLVAVHPGITAITTVDHCLGRLAATAGDREAALGHLEDALARCEETGAVTLAPRTQLARAQVLAADARHRGEAEALAHDALAASARLGLGHPASLLPFVSRRRHAMPATRASG